MSINRATRPKNVLEGTATGFQKGASTGDHPNVEADQLIKDSAQNKATLANAVLKRTNLPLNVTGSTYLFRPDYYWGDWTDTTYTARTPNNTRLGYASKIHNFNPAQADEYSAGIDNLYGLGENYVSKSYDLPLGITASMEYDGDGTLGGSLEIPQKQYYLAALMNLLRGR